MIKTKNIVILFLSFILCVLTLSLPRTALKPRADDVLVNFDNTSIVDDLTTSIVNGQPFDITDYPAKSGSPMRLFNLVEYCYSYKLNLQSYYGLYLYVYNPSTLDINVNSLSNKVQIGIEYDSSGKPIDYGKFSLKFCSKITGGDYNNLFYKFKVIDPDNIILNRINETDPYKRRYDISGFEMLITGSMNAIEYTVGYSYIFTGFAVGFGNNNTNSTLEYFPSELETIELKVNSTNYRPSGWSSLGEYHQDDLISVYFSVPNKYIEEYGYIKRIKAEWYEYKTNPIIVNNNYTSYSYLKNYVGYDVGSSGDDNIAYSLFKHNYLYGDGGDFHASNYKWSWNAFLGFKNNHGISSDYNCTMFPFLFYPGSGALSDATISKEQLADYIYSYNKSFKNGTLDIKSGSISADLFQNSVDNGRKMGYNEKIFDSDNPEDWYDLKSGDIRSGWDKFWDSIFKGKDWDETVYFNDLKPIVFIESDDLLGSEQDIADRLFINKQDVSAFKAYYNANKNDKTVVLFRIANTDYHSFPLTIMNGRIPTITGSNLINNSAYYAQETVLLDFDIIWLDLMKDGVSTIIPVVSNPIDVISAVTPPLGLDTGCTGFTFEIPDWFWLVAGIVILVIVLAFLSAIITPIKYVLYVVFLPFVIIYYVFKPKGGG